MTGSLEQKQNTKTKKIPRPINLCKGKAHLPRKSNKKLEWKLNVDPKQGKSAIKTPSK